MINSSRADTVLNHPVWQAAGLAYLSIATLCGVVSNAGILLVLALHRSLRNSVNAAMANIAACDLLVSSFVLPTAIAQRITSSQLLPPWLCSTSAAALMLCVGVSNFCFAWIGVNRWVFVLHSCAYKRLLAGRIRQLLLLLLMWLLWLVICVIMYLQRSFAYVRDSFICFFDDQHVSFGGSFALFLVAVWLPSGLAGICYWRLISALAASRRRVEGSLAASAQQLEQSKALRSLLPIAATYAAFNLMWLPYCVQTYVVYAFGNNPSWEHSIFVWVALSNCFVKPLLQLTLQPIFRQKFVQLLTCSKQSD